MGIEGKVIALDAEGALIIDEIRGGAAQAGLERLLVSAFPVPAGASFFDDFPVWDERHGFDVCRLGAYVGSRLIASACARMTRLASGAPVAIVGAVATDESWRGKGVASSLVAQLLSRIEKRGLAGIFLWSGQREFYSRLGFDVYGDQARVALAELPAFRSEEMSFGTGWVPSLMPYLLTRAGGLRIEAKDLAWVASHRNIQWFWTGSAEAPSSYAAVGKGIDLAGIVHEWGGDVQVLRALLAHIAERVPGAELISPVSRLVELGAEPGSEIREPLCLAKILDPTQMPEELWFWGLDGA